VNGLGRPGKVPVKEPLVAGTACPAADNLAAQGASGRPVTAERGAGRSHAATETP
jgi:hypothetical protein